AGGARLVEPLSERELAVLRYLPSRLSNREIGAELYVSLNTVKSHLKAIYRKLDVDSRQDAVRRARQMGIL
ncbi:MAG: LuxR C-terminal-related transcriptional regulator, partial [Acidimicrobiia bacterium]